MKHWNWLSEDTATFPYPRNSKPGQMPFGKGCFNHIQNLSLSTEKTKKKKNHQSYIVRGKMVHFGFNDF